MPIQWNGIHKLGDENDIIEVEVNNVLTEKKISNVFGVIKGIVDSGQTQLARHGELERQEELVSEFALPCSCCRSISGYWGPEGRLGPRVRHSHCRHQRPSRAGAVLL